jgi:hypothetical protein
MKKNLKLFLGGAGIGLLILALIILFVPSKSSNSSFFNDQELGLIKYKIYEESIFQKLFKSEKQAFFSTTTSTLGKAVTISDYIPVQASGTYSKENLVSADLYIEFGYEIAKIPILSKIPANVLAPRIDISYTPQKTGDYEAYSVIKFKNGEVYETAKTNKMRVTTPETACSKKAYFTEWVTTDSITGGKIQDRDFKSVTNTCEWKVSSTESRIVCNSGYAVKGTESTVATYTGVQSCEAVVVVSQCPGSECNADIQEECSDGTSIVNQKCSSGCLVPTGNFCSVVDIETPVEEIIDQTPVEQPITDVPEENSIPEEKTFMEKYESYFIYGGIAIVVILLLLIFWNLARRR